MRYSYLDTDRGPAFTLLCLAVAFGIVMGAFALPLLILCMQIAGLIFLGLSYLIGSLLADIIATIIYFSGAFAIATVATVIYEPVAVYVSDAFSRAADYFWPRATT
jgi:hypothetical protein